MRIRLAVLTAVASILALTAVSASAKPVFMPNIQHRLAQQNALHGSAASGGGITPPAPPCPENGQLYPAPSGWPSAVPYLFSNCGITELPATGLPIPGNMAYWGGKVQVHPKEYLVYWGWGAPGAFPNQTCSPETFTEGTISTTLQCDPDGAGKYMADFVHQMGGSDWAKVSTQFYETIGGKTDHISNDRNVLGGTWVDDTNDITPLAKTSSSNPAGPTNTYWDLAEEALRATAHFGLEGSALADANIIIVQPPAYSDPNALNAGYCAFHDLTDPNAPGNGYYKGLTMPDGSTPPYIQYTNIPYQIAPSLASGCGEKVEGGKLDGFSIVLGHEIEETITDPGGEYLDPTTNVEYGGWYDTVDADENGDKCAWVGYGLAANPVDGSITPMPGALGATTGNEGTKFPVQSIWSNADNQGTGYCAGAGTDSPAGAVAYGGTAPDTPANTTAPAFTAKPIAGRALTAPTGSWTGKPTDYVYQWQACTSTGCADITGATSSSYTPTRSELGQRLAVEVYAANEYGSSVAAVSAPSAPIATAPKHHHHHHHKPGAGH